MAGSYTCTVYAYTTPSIPRLYFDNSFTFSLTMGPTVPRPPIDLTATSASTTLTSVEFSWMAPVYDGGSPITGYKIWWDQGEDY